MYVMTLKTAGARGIVAPDTERVKCQASSFHLLSL